MKVKFVSYFIDGGNQKYKELAALTQEINKKYCQLYNYDLQYAYMTEQQFVDFYPKRDRMELHDYKVPFISFELNKQDCDILVFIDADATISKPTIKIEDLLDNEHELFICRGNEKVLQAKLIVDIHSKLTDIIKREYSEEKYVATHYWDQIMKEYSLFESLAWLSWDYILLNEGFIIIKNTQNMRDFYNHATFLQKEYFIDFDRQLFGEKCYTERVIKFMLLQQKYKPLYTFLPDFAQGGSQNLFETKYDEDKTFILHNYGQALTLDQKVEQVKLLKKNKWWKGLI